jgi:hypothetical protein
VWLEPIPCEFKVRRVDQANAVGEFVAGKHGARRRLSLFPVLLWGDHLKKALNLMKATKSLYCTESDSQREIAALAVPSSIPYCSEIFSCRLLSSLGKEARTTLLRYKQTSSLVCRLLLVKLVHQTSRTCMSHTNLTQFQSSTKIENDVERSGFVKIRS